jgi:hypothetical protein
MRLKASNLKASLGHPISKSLFIVCVVIAYSITANQWAPPLNVDRDVMLSQILVTKASNANINNNRKLPDNPEAWIVQGDSKLLSPFRTRINTTTYLELMAAINLHYAQTHDYLYTRFLFAAEHACSHPAYGRRHVAWCKLLAITHILETAPDSVKHVVWLDSDAILQKQQWSIPDIIDSIPTGCNEDDYCYAPYCLQHRRVAALLTTVDPPYCGEAALTAFQIWNRHQDYMPILKEWWNANQCNQLHPWEQRAFSRNVYTKFALREPGGIAYLGQDVNHPQRPEEELRKLFLRHVGHFDKGGRRLIQAHAVAQLLNMTAEQYTQLHQELLDQYTQQFTSLDAKRLSGLLARNASEREFLACFFFL